METSFRQIPQHTPFLFKSYYVVWKLHCKYEMHIDAIEFKSYYVVWKQMSPTFLVLSSISFKSYYVVWKRSTRRGKTQRKNRFNRTM